MRTQAMATAEVLDIEPEAAVEFLKNLVESERSGLDTARQLRVSAAYQPVEAQWEHEEKATKKKAKKVCTLCVSTHQRSAQTLHRRN